MKNVERHISRFLPIFLLWLYPLLDVWAENAVKIETVVMKAGETTKVPIVLENTDKISSLRLDVTLPKGITYENGSLTLNEERVHSDDFDVMFNNQTSQYTDEEKELYVAESVYRLTVLRKDAATISGTSGALAYITVRAAEDFKKDSEINIIKTSASYDAQKVVITGSLDVKVISLNLQINDEVYKKLSAQIIAVQTELNNAKSTINSECMNVVAQFAERVSGIQNEIDALTADLKTKYDNVELTAESTIETAEISSSIEKLVTDAKTAQKVYEEEQAKIAANEAAYIRLTAQIDEVQNALDAAETTISTDCKDVASRFTAQIANIQNSIDALSIDVKLKYDSVKLTAESTIGTSAISSSIEKLLSDAQSAQQAYEDEQAKIAANEAAYTRLTEQIANVQKALDVAQTTIDTDCKDVASQFTEQIVDLQNRINATVADVKTKYESVSLTADSKIDTASITSAIEKLVADAKAAQQAYEDEQAKIAANEAAYTRLTEQIAEVQKTLDAAKATINADCKDVVGQFAAQISDLQNRIAALSSDVKTKYESVSLTADSKIDTASITSAIEKLVADAKAAQQAYEDEQAKIAANEAAYTRLTEQIAEVQKTLDAAKATINADCKDVAGQFTTQITDLQNRIAALSSDVKTKYESVSLTADSKIDTASITSAIEKLVADAKAAQQAYEDEQAKIAANEAAYTRLTEQIAEVQKTLDAAKATINADCKDVAGQFTTQITDLQNRIAALSSDVKTKYESVSLTADSKIDTASITSAIEKLVADAKAAQQAYEDEQAKIAANEAAYTRLTEQIAEVQKTLDAAKATINADCKDVAGQFTTQITDLQNRIAALSSDVKTKYESVSLTADSKIDTASITSAIEKLVADAKAAQQAYEDEQAKIAANETAYTRLTEQIAEVQKTLDAAKATINAECKDVAGQFTTQISDLQNRIAALSSDVKTKYESVSLTADSKIDTASITSAIEKLVADAKAAQQAYEDEQAKIAANEAAYTRLTEQIAEVQKTLDAAKTTISTDCKDVAGQFGEQIASIQTRIDALNSDVKTKYDRVELTAESTIDTAAITTSIEKMLADAFKAQELFEAGEAAKLANEVAYARLTEQIATIQSALDAAKTTIETDCKDVAEQFTEQITDLQNQINALAADVKSKYDKVELTAESTIDTASIATSIETLLTDAKAAQKADEDEQAKIVANEIAYTRLIEQITEIQKTLDAAKDSIETNYKAVAGQFEEQIDSIQNTIHAMSADVEAKYENVELTAESVVDIVSLTEAITELLASAEKAQKEYEEALSIGSVEAGEQIVGIYSLTGKKVSEVKEGMIYIFRYKNGKAVKRMVK